MVEAADEVAAKLDVLGLVLADRDFGGFIKKDVGGHEDRVGKDAHSDSRIGHLRALVLELGHPLQLAHVEIVLEDGVQLGVGRDARLKEYRRLLRVKARSEVEGRDVARVVPEVFRLNRKGQGMEVGDEDETFALVLKILEVGESSDIVPEGQFARRLDSRKNAFHILFLCRAILAHLGAADERASP